MVFSSRAEYGVRLLVELGRHVGEEPLPLNAIADAERLPLTYLERIVAVLKRAGLVTSTRGAHGGYRLSRPPEEITMDEAIQALEGGLAPMECFTDTPVNRVVCSHEGDGGRACATKLLWARVQGGMVRAMQQTTLAELVEFSSPRPTGLGAVALPQAAPPPAVTV